jgi:hypothetical protein
LVSTRILPLENRTQLSPLDQFAGRVIAFYRHRFGQCPMMPTLLSAFQQNPSSGESLIIFPVLSGKTLRAYTGPLAPLDNDNCYIRKIEYVVIIYSGLRI